MLSIKRYANRKLYNTQIKKYISLDEIGELIRCNQDILISDHLSGRDITSYILSNLMMEHQKRGVCKVPPWMLIWLLRMGWDNALVDQAEGELDGWYLDMLPTAEDLKNLNAQLDLLSKAIEQLQD